VNLLSERRLAIIDRAVTSGRILPYLALSTVIITFIAGVGAWVLAPQGFGSLGDTLWWAAQTVTTVGYGDVVPSSGWGRVIGVVVMVFGVAAVSLITALVTSAVVAFEQRRRTEQQEAEHHHPVHETLARIEQRLEAIENRLA
jgi:voltage-gated potassium channel